MTNEEKWEAWRNANAEIQKPYEESVHKHIIWYQGVDRRKAFLDGLEEGRKETIKKIAGVINDNNSTYGDLRESLGIKWADTDLEKENAELKKQEEILLDRILTLQKTNGSLTDKINVLESQIEKIKCFIHSEIDFCTYCPLTHECRNEEGTCPYAYATEEEQKKILTDWIIGSWQNEETKTMV